MNEKEHEEVKNQLSALMELTLRLEDELNLTIVTIKNPKSLI